jgi:hypothetical protein
MTDDRHQLFVTTRNPLRPPPVASTRYPAIPAADPGSTAPPPAAPPPTTTTIPTPANPSTSRSITTSTRGRPAGDVWCGPATPRTTPGHPRRRARTPVSRTPRTPDPQRHQPATFGQPDPNQVEQQPRATRELRERPGRELPERRHDSGDRGFRSGIRLSQRHHVPMTAPPSRSSGPSRCPTSGSTSAVLPLRQWLASSSDHIGCPRWCIRFGLCC